MPTLEKLLKLTILEARAEFGIDELCALLAGRIESRFIVIDRLSQRGRTFEVAVPPDLDIERYDQSDGDD